jgi:lipopolysaccharide/colanic/teichoic acid biosynthesis glycosyltransferase
MKSLIIEKAGKDVLTFLEKYVDVESEKTLVVSTTNTFNILNNQNRLHSLINLSRTNDIRFINKFFNAVNSKLTKGDLYIGCLETLTSRMLRLPIGKIPVIGTAYFTFEFIFNRLAPKTPILKKIYFLVTRGRRRLLSKAEVLGRLVCCGFEIMDHQAIVGLTYFVVKKVKEPAFDMNPSYHAIFKMQRLGKNGKMIGVYKMRTMHAYAEYLQGYVLENNGYAPTGKPANDFRLTPWGRVMRKYWLDELPQLLNVVKGDLKLVGVRPITRRYAQDIPQDLLELRLKHKPGCIPPYVALDRKGNVKDVLQAEREYLLEKNARPYTTDTRYFFKAVYNIVFRKKRSA